jgi:hypothetical protein
VADKEPQEPFKRGPKGGKKHTPGRGHDRKSAVSRKERFKRKAIRKKEQERKELEEKWELWDSLSEDAKKLQPELKPKKPRPRDA